MNTRRRAAYRAARRDLRRATGTRHAPHLEIRIRLTGPAWDQPGDARGITGITTTIPLDRRGIRYLLGTVRRIRAACIAGLAHRYLTDQENDR